jgi:hypothetical protein
MKFTIFVTSALIATTQAQIVSENGANYFVYPSAGGNTMVSGPQGSTYIQPSPIGANVISTGRGIDQGAIVAAQMARPAPMPQTAANAMANALDQYQSQQSAAWAQANQTMSAALASMAPISENFQHSSSNQNAERFSKAFWNWCKQNRLYDHGQKIPTQLAEEMFLVWITTIPVKGHVDFKEMDKQKFFPKAFNEWVDTYHIFDSNQNIPNYILFKTYGIWLKKALEYNPQNVASNVAAHP